MIIEIKSVLVEYPSGDEEVYHNVKGDYTSTQQLIENDKGEVIGSKEIKFLTLTVFLSGDESRG